MIVTTDSKALSNALTTAAKAAARSSSIPVLRGVRLSASADTLSLACTDMEVSIETTIDCESAEAGTVLVDAKTVRSMLKGRTGLVTLSTADDRLDLDGSSLPLLDPEDFPRFRVCADQVATVEALPLQDVARRAGVAASRDDSRPILTGVKIEIADGKLRMIATDSYRLAVVQRETGTGTFDGIVPARATDLVAKLVKSGAVNIGAGDGAVSFTSGRTRITTRLLDGQFPDWQRLIPDAFTTDAHDNLVPAQALVDALTLVKPACLRNAPARLTFSTDGNLRVHGSTQDGPSASVVVEGCRVNETMEIGVNCDFLSDVAHILGTEGSYRAQTISPSRPLRFLNGTDESWYLVMPVRLAS